MSSSGHSRLELLDANRNLDEITSSPEHPQNLVYNNQIMDTDPNYRMPNQAELEQEALQNAQQAQVQHNQAKYLIELNKKMERENIEDVYKALRLLPDFDGNPNVLTRFIKLCDELVDTFIADPSLQLTSLVLINGILNKVTGQAARLINSNGIPNDWQGIRAALINNFADQRDETSLYNDLALLTQGQDTPQEFYERCQNLFSTIMTYVSLHENIPSTIDSKQTLYKKLTLQAFVRGLKDPLGSRIRCMRPPTIEKALEYVHEESNTMYIQNHSPAFTHQAKPHNFNMPGPSRPNPLPPTHGFRPPPISPMWKPPQMFQGPSRTQQMFRAPPPNYNPQNNAFRMNPQNNNFRINPQFNNFKMNPQNNYFRSNTQFNAPRPSGSNQPQPMSGVSHYVTKPMPIRGHDWTRSGNPPPSNYFRTREMNFNMCHDYEPYYDYNNYDYDSEYSYDQNYYGEDYSQYYQPAQDTYYPTAIEQPQEEEPLPSNEDFHKSQKSDTLK